MNISKLFFATMAVMAFSIGGAGAAISPYVGAQLNFNISSFSNDVSFEISDSKDSFDYSSANTMAFELSGGANFTKKLRSELNLAYFSKFTSNEGAGFEFKMQQNLITANVLYDVLQMKKTSVYVGAGAGIGILTTEFVADKTSVGLAGRAIVGLEEKITDNFAIGLNYKLTYLTGHEKKVDVDFGTPDVLKIETSGILTHSIGLALRHSF